MITKKRITIMLDEGLEKKLRAIQAKELKQSSQSVSFSKIVNQYLRKEIYKKNS